MAELLSAWWPAAYETAGLRKADRRGCRYSPYIPDPLSSRDFDLDGQTAADVAYAERAIASLDHRAVALVDTETIARLLLRAEAVASSEIEGLIVGPRRLLEFDALREDRSGSAPGDEAAMVRRRTRDVTADEVLANIDAMAYATQAFAPDDDIRVEHLLEMHRRLLQGSWLDKHAGTVRSVQNWIGGSNYNPCSAAFVPPPPEYVEPLLQDLCEFCNEERLPAVAQAAIAHAQFELIHPFVDGNGRVGRALIHMVLRKRGLARRIVPPVSLILATHSNQYVDALKSTRYTGDAGAAEAKRASNPWIALFASACTRAVRDSEIFEDRIADLQRSWRERVGPARAHSAVLAVLGIVPGAPILTVKTAAALSRRSAPAVNAAVARLLDAGVLRQTRAQERNRVFEAPEVIEAFISLERGLASPVGDTGVSPPVRPVPARPVARMSPASDRDGATAPEDRGGAFRNRQP